MTASKLDQALAAYRSAIDSLKSSQKLDPASVLAVLKARDDIARILSDDRPDPTAGLLVVIELDNQLRKLAGAITQAIKLADWRASFQPPPEAWWWSLESVVPPEPVGRFDWLWSALTVLFLTASLSLMAEISKRFLMEGQIG